MSDGYELGEEVAGGTGERGGKNNKCRGPGTRKMAFLRKFSVAGL